MAGGFPSWQTTLIVVATHWHRDEAQAPRNAVATVQLRARADGALMVTVSNGEEPPDVLMFEPGEAPGLLRVQEAIFAHQQVRP